MDKNILRLFHTLLVNFIVCTYFSKFLFQSPKMMGTNMLQKHIVLVSHIVRSYREKKQKKNDRKSLYERNDTESGYLTKT